MEQYRSITNDIGEAIGKIGSEYTRNLAAKGAEWKVLEKILS
jgi:hypothetical protein